MRKIVLMCAAGISTSVLLKKMQEAAANMNYECQIDAYPTSEAAQQEDADIILLGPQVRFQLDKIRELFPGKIVEVIEMKMYGRLDGRAIIEFAKKKLGD